MIRTALSWHLAFILAIGTSAAIAGCDFVENDNLVVATTWPSAECARIEADFAKWISTRPVSDGLPPRKSGMTWIWLSSGDDLEQFLHKRKGVDVILGGVVESYSVLDSNGLLQPAMVGKDPAWLAIDSASIPSGTAASQAAQVEPRLLLIARKELSQSPWLLGYEKLIRLSERDDQRPDLPKEHPPGEGAAISARSRHPERAKEFLKFLIDRRGAKPGSIPSTGDLDDHGLLADLLRATLIDSREELDAAWGGLRNLEDREQSFLWMCEPPPWPPASIEKILSRGEQAMTMLESLAGQITPDPSLRSWLLQSWLTPRRAIDGALFRELAGVEEGRLAREPRFRSWLRAEWTAWARQRYRRVARQARLGLSIPRIDAAIPSRVQPEGADTR